MAPPDRVAAHGAPTGHQPALDGVRALAVAAVVLFHAEVPGASGGYLGVSVFFTLSGFLITRLLLTEHDTTGSIRLGRFFARRARRLVPASCTALVLIVVADQLGWFGTVDQLRRDVVAAAVQLANWEQLTSGTSYADLFDSGVSPVAHFWSLSIEEQFYLVWPVTVIAILAVLRGSVHRLGTAITSLAAVSMVVPVLIHTVWGPDAVYLSTPARASELLIGAALAVRLRHGGASAWWRWLAPVALALIAVACVLTPAGRGWAYSGGLPVFALASAALIAGLQVDGPVRRLLSVRPLVSVGAVSYGIYLYHWPVFVALDLDPLPLLLVGSAITAVLTVASHRLVERPIRSRSDRPLSPRRDVPVAVGAMALTALCGLLVLDPPVGTISVDPERAAAVAIVAPDVEAPAISPSSTSPSSTPPPTTSPVDTTAGPTTSSTVDDGPRRILVIGDSTSVSIGSGLVDWAFARGDDAVQVSVLGFGGCGFVAGGQFGTFLDFARDRCDARMREEVPAAIEALRPHVVVVSISGADTWDRSWDGGTTVLPSTDPAYRARIEADYLSFFDTAVERGATRIVWLRPPVSSLYEDGEERQDPSWDNGSQEFVEQQVRSAADRHPGVVEVLDLRTHLETTGFLDDPAARPDNMHLSDDASLRLATDWLGPELLARASAR